MTESIIQHEPFPKYFCIFDIISNISSMSLTLILVSTFESQ